MRIGTRGSALALAQAQFVARPLGGAEVVTIATSGEARVAAATATSRAGCWSSSSALRARRDRPRGALRQGRPRRAGRRPGAAGRARASGGRGRALRSGAASSSSRRARAWARAACAAPPSCARCARISRSCRCGATWTPVCATWREGDARRARARPRRSSPPRSRGRGRGGARPRPLRPRPRPGHARAGGPRRRRAHAGRPCRRSPTPRRLPACGPSAPLAHALGASCHTPLGAHAVDYGCGCLHLRAWVGLPDGSAWVGDELLGGFYDPEALGRRVAERMRAAGAAELLTEAEEMVRRGSS